MENMGIRKLTEELRKLNPGVNFSFNADTYPGLIIADCNDFAMLNLPVGYYISPKNGLTNQHNTANGQYEHFELMTEYEYLTELA